MKEFGTAKLFIAALFVIILGVSAFLIMSGVFGQDVKMLKPEGGGKPSKEPPRPVEMQANLNGTTPEAFGFEQGMFEPYGLRMPSPEQGGFAAIFEGMSPKEIKARNEAISRDVAAGNLFIINKEFPVDKNYKAPDLAGIKYFAPDRAAETRFMRSEAAQAFNSMIEAAANDGYKIVMTTAYRSYDFQKMLYTNYVNKYGQAEADTFSARPGTSEHQGGLAADISAASVNYQLSSDFGKTKEGIWIAENAHNFGFIIRYPEGKTDITGYIYEPWHVRYVGKTAASEIYRLGCTLEEYCMMNGIGNDDVSAQ